MLKFAPVGAFYYCDVNNSYTKLQFRIMSLDLIEAYYKYLQKLSMIMII